MKSYLREQANRVISRIENKELKSITQKGLAEEAWQAELEVRLGSKEFIPLLENIIKQAGQEAMFTVGSDFKFSLTANIRSWLDKKTRIFLEKINETTFEQLKLQFEESLALNENRQELIQRIKNTYQTIEKGRAKTIARTEVHGVSQEGNFQGYKQTGVPIKVWVAVLDDRTRDTHRDLAMDGQEVPMNMPFSNGLMYPGDPSGAPEEVINCRCSI